MKKYASFLLIPLAVIAVVSFVVPSNAQAQVQGVACPVGYTCVPISQNMVNCPVGYTCSPRGSSVDIINADGSSSSCYIFSKDLTVGSLGADVLALQKAVSSYATIGSQSDLAAYYGQSTAAAVKNYQINKGIPATGIVDPLTRATLHASCNPNVTSKAPYITSVGQLFVPFATAYRDVDTGSNISVTLLPIFNLSVGDKKSEFTVNNVKVSLGTNKEMITSKFKLFTTDATGKILKVLSINPNTVVQMPDGSYSISMPVGISMDSNSTHNFAIAVEKANVGIFVKNTTIPRDSIRTTDPSGISYTGPTQTIYPLKESSAFSKNCGLTVNAPTTGSQVDFPLTIQGVIDNTRSRDNGCAWGMFESVGGTAQLYYFHDNEWKILGASLPIIVDDWTSVKTNFKSTINFSNDYVGIPPGTPLKITLIDDNASGIPQYQDTFDVFVYSKVSPKTETKDTKSSTFNGTLSAALFSVEEDYAGAWDNFGPGAGYGNSNKSDWGWQVSLKVDDANKVIKSMTILSDIGGEGWSTSRDATDLGKSLYPLVVMSSHGSGQINKEYKDNLAITQPTGYYVTYYLYGQKESNQSVPGGKLIVRFTDGSQAVMKITNPNTNQVSISNQPNITDVTSKANRNFEIDAGGLVGISGTNLMSSYKVDNKVYIGGMLGNVTQIDNNLIYFRAPSSLTSGLTYDLYVVNDKGTSNIVKVKVVSTVTQSSIVVLSPNGGESYKSDQQITIGFNRSGGQRTFISLVDSNNEGFDLISNNNYNYHNISDPYYPAIGGGLYDSVVSLYLPKDWVASHGTQYKIEICAGNKCDRSDNYFTVNTSGTIQTAQLNPFVWNKTITLGQSISQQFVVDNISSGNAWDQWNFGKGTSPNGIGFKMIGAFAGQLYGTPTNTGNFSFTIQAYSTKDAQSAYGTVYLTVLPATSPSPSPSPTYSPTPTPNSNTSSSPTPTPNSVSNQTRINSINQLFATLLNRQPDAQGLAYFAGSSMTIDQIRSIIMSSQEYKILHTVVQQVSPSPSTSPSTSPTNSPSSSPSAMNVGGNSLKASILNAVAGFLNSF